MSKRNKLQRFADILSFPNVYENFDIQTSVLLGEQGKEVEMKGKWHAHFKNDHPITLELACGRGEYSLGLARMHPNRNFIGVDIKGARIWQGAQIALEEGLTNVAFLRTRIEQIANFFEKGEVSEIWIIFPDPFLKKESRRLTAPNFLHAYRKFLCEEHLIHLKTDSPELYEFTMETLAQHQDQVQLLYEDDNIYTKALPMPELGIKTYYEKRHLKDKRTIKYVRMKLV